jgi:hypothetical protein
MTVQQLFINFMKVYESGEKHYITAVLQTIAQNDVRTFNCHKIFKTYTLCNNLTELVYPGKLCLNEPYRKVHKDNHFLCIS